MALTRSLVHLAKGKGGGKGNGKSKGKGKGRGKRHQPRDSSNTPKCHMYVRHGKCANDDCPCSHWSQDQVKRALGQGGSDKRDQSRGSNDADHHARGRGRGQGKGKGGKAESRGKSARAKSEDAAATEVQQLKSKPRWRTAH